MIYDSVHGLHATFPWGPQLPLFQSFGFPLYLHPHAQMYLREQCALPLLRELRLYEIWSDPDFWPIPTLCRSSS